MRTDLFRNHKGIHIKLQKDVHADFRRELFTYGLSMQKVFNEFARLVAAKDNQALKMIQGLVRRELKKEIEKYSNKQCDLDITNEQDQEALYDLIESED